MSIHYASERIGKEVTGQLKAVALELGTDDQLHLPDFLDVDPCGSYKQWTEKLSEKRKATVNAPEGTADKQVLLCQTLTKEFKAEKDWRGLLNRLGRMQIEKSIGGLARRKPAPDVLRNVFITHIHTLKVIVGAPDAQRIVEDLFEEKNVQIPEEPEAVVIPEPEAIQPEPEIRSVPPAMPEIRPKPTQPPAQTEGGFWGRLRGALTSPIGSALIEALGEHLDRKVNEARERAENERTVIAQTPDISGQWYSPAGGVFTFSQRGLRVSVEGIGAGPMSGQGQIRGRAIQLQGFSPTGGPFRANLIVSPDGNSITGQTVDGRGQASLVQLQR